MFAIAIGSALVGAALVAVPSLVIDARNAALEREAAADAERAAEQAERDRLRLFSNALWTCDIEQGNGVEILDAGEAIEFRGVGRSFASAVQLSDIDCFLDEIDAPTVVSSKIGSTRALDGTQGDSWNGVEATWRYHPDSGATITFEHAE